MRLNNDPLRISFKETGHLLPYTTYHTEVKNGRPDVLFHWHPEMEINYIHKGSARFHIDYDYFNSQEGDIILIRPNGMHSIHPLDNQEHITDTIRFHLDMIGQSAVDQVSLHYLQPLQTSTYKFVQRIQPDMKGYDELKTCLFTIFELSQQKSRHFELLLKAKLNEFMYHLYFNRYVLRKNTDDMYRKNEKIRELIDFINANYHEDLSIDYLSQFMGYSKTHFMSVFKQQTGSSCTDYIIQVRLNRACDLLINTTNPILEISTGVGFNNLSNFNRQFKRYNDMTPRQYRKKFSNRKESTLFINPSKQGNS